MSNQAKVGMWIALGAIGGLAFGAVTHRIGAFAGIGIAIGVALGLALTRDGRK